MPAFYQDLERFGADTAIKCLSVSNEISEISYSDLQTRITQFSQQLTAKRSLVVLIAENNLDTLIAYLSCLQNQHPVILLDKNTKPQQLDDIVKRFQPNYIVKQGVVEQENVETQSKTNYSFDARLAVMLSTSGSTGSPKMVALSYDNIQSNADSIRRYLPIHATDTTITTLPFAYSYGLSIINSHLLVGSSIFLSDVSVVDKAFWQILDKAEITSFGGVPYTYEMLIRLGLTKKELPFLRYFTQAGGKLAEKKVAMLRDYAQSHCKKFYVIYGQTEATARMSYVEPRTLESKCGTIGKAIPDGKFALYDESGNEITTPNVNGELIYQGPNVMLGYAESLSDLLTFEAIDSLKTGDVAYFDIDGDFFITGRLKRFIKVFGLRISLDEVEQQLHQQGLECQTVGEDNKLRVAVNSESLARKGMDSAGLIKYISSQLGIHHSTINIREIDNLPQNANGKADYQKTEQLFAEKRS